MCRVVFLTLCSLTVMGCLSVSEKKHQEPSTRASLRFVAILPVERRVHDEIGFERDFYFIDAEHDKKSPLVSSKERLRVGVGFGGIEPRLARNGRKLYFLADRLGSTIGQRFNPGQAGIDTSRLEMWSLDFVGGRVEPLPPVRGIAGWKHFGVSPNDGSIWALKASWGGLQGESTLSLYVIDLVRCKSRQIATGASISVAGFNSTGSLLSFVKDGRLYSFDLSRFRVNESVESPFVVHLAGVNSKGAVVAISGNEVYYRKGSSWRRVYVSVSNPDVYRLGSGTIEFDKTGRRAAVLETPAEPSRFVRFNVVCIDLEEERITIPYKAARIREVLGWSDDNKELYLLESGDEQDHIVAVHIETGQRRNVFRADGPIYGACEVGRSIRIP